MSQKSLPELKSDVERVYIEIQGLLEEAFKKSLNPSDKSDLNEMGALIDMLHRLKKEQKITLEELEMQTEISNSTLKRLFKNPENARVGHLLKVLNELGVKVWVEK